ncbi:acyl-CoA dehydrogenase family protein [Streptomyces albus]|uniref:acyl-CoA dehydrogenase family protein n=1 Tax=Streptomyces albus TaxID=1888 RepID=UPI0024AD36C1|nr:acyl-CoA dehydrogenase family protein [Streptomyces albus]MDI6411953.1 acyl-CoA dehydrogenase family protein [Streptomyces albus]
MDFTPTEEQTAARDLAAGIFADLATHERLSEQERSSAQPRPSAQDRPSAQERPSTQEPSAATAPGGTQGTPAARPAPGTGVDEELWKALCGAGLVGAAEETGLVGLALVLEEQGRRTAPVPLAATSVYGLLPVAAHGTPAQRARLLPGLRDGTLVATGAFPLPDEGAGPVTEEGGLLTGTVPVVPWLRTATHVLVPVGRAAGGGTARLFLVGTDQDTVAVTPVETTAPWAAGRLELSAARGEPLGDGGAYAATLERARTAFAALQAGVCAGSLALAVAHTCEREQFGRPLSTNQAVQLRAADAHMDTEAIRVTCYEAAWRHDAGLPAGPHALTAAWWAAEAGRRVVHAGQHLHGGVGADITHPVHRHFLWGRQLDAYLGPPAALLAELGEALADPEGDAAWRDQP